ncbi:MAG: amino acid ABC transporter substrate-binding protein [Mangrovicoccus sp.]|nr:amino acid ABC transporter substrate-binding protein [Mangrovicoccus sp.]
MTVLRSLAAALSLAAASLLSPVAAQADDLTGTLARISDTGVITLGYRTSAPPLSFADAAGQPAGYSVGLCQAIAEETRQTLERPDLEIRYVAVTAEDRFDRLASGDIDLLCGVTTKTLERAGSIGFTDLTFITGGGLLSMDDGDRIEHFSQLPGRKIAVAPGTSTHEALTVLLEAEGIKAEFVSFDDKDAAMAALTAGEVDVYAADQVVLIGKVLSQTDESLNYFLAGDLFSFEPYALALAYGDTEFKLVADRALARLNRSGLVLALYKQWFGSFGQSPTAAQRALWQLGATPE